MNVFEEAIEWNDKILALYPTHRPSLMDKATFLYQSGRVDEAVVVAGEHLQLYPNDTTALTNMGNGLLGQGKCLEAIPFYDKALILIEANFGIVAHAAILKFYKAAALFHLNRYDESLEWCKKALSTEKNRFIGHCWHLKGELDMEKQMWTEAIQSYTNSLEVIPWNQYAEDRRKEAKKKAGELPKKV